VTKDTWVNSSLVLRPGAGNHVCMANTRRHYSNKDLVVIERPRYDVFKGPADGSVMGSPSNNCLVTTLRRAHFETSAVE
jgi:hypothetical protein